MTDAPTATGPIAVYVGAGDDRIRWYELDPTALTLAPRGSVATGGGPSFLAFDPSRRWLVAVNEGDSALESFAMAADGSLARVNAKPAPGGPAHVTVDATGRWALTGSYGAGRTAVFPVAADGTLGDPVDDEPSGEKAHQVVLNPANTIAYVPCLGANHVAVYNFDAQTGALALRTNVATQGGPRHLALHPDGTHAFVINELASTITTYTVEADGDLVPGATVSTLPADFGGSNTGAELAVNAAGTYVYASNRGHDSIVRFAFTGGSLTDARHVSTFGAGPRHFSLVLGDAAMLVGNQRAGSVRAFRIGADGVPTPVGEVATATDVGFVGAIQLP